MSRAIAAHKAQAMKEYVLIAACVVAVLIAMKGYLKGGIVAKYRDTADSVFGGQFDPAGTGTFTAASTTKGTSASITTFRALNDTKGNRAFVLLSHQESGVGMTVDKEGNQTFDPTSGKDALESSTTEYSTYAFENGTELK